MTDKYEEFKEWFKHHPIDEDELDLVFAIGNLFRKFEEEQAEKQKEEEILDLIMTTIYNNTTTLEYYVGEQDPAKAVYNALKEKDMIK